MGPEPLPAFEHEDGQHGPGGQGHDLEHVDHRAGHDGAQAVVLGAVGAGSGQAAADEAARVGPVREDGALDQADDGRDGPLQPAEQPGPQVGEHDGRDDQGEGVVGPERLEQDRGAAGEGEGGLVAVGQVIAPDLEQREQHEDHQQGAGQLPPPAGARPAALPGQRGQHRERGGDRLLAHRDAPHPEQQGQHQRRSAVGAQGPLAQDQAGDGGQVGRDVLHERRRQQGVAGEEHDQPGGEHAGRAPGPGRGQAIGEHGRDDAEHGHDQLLGRDRAPDRADEHDLADERAAVPAQQVDVPATGEGLGDLAVGPGVVVRDRDAAGVRGPGQRGADGDHQHRGQGGRDQADLGPGRPPAAPGLGMRAAP